MPETKPLVITRVFNAPVAKVWAAWTEPEQIKKWWGPRDFTGPAAEVDLRVGGKYLFCMRGRLGPDMPEQDFWSTGTYEEIVPLQKLVYLDSFANEKGEAVSPEAYGMSGVPEVMRVQIELETLPDGTTQMTLTHTGAPAGKHLDNMTEGWKQSLDKLAESVEE